jgi:TonB family protein
VRPLDASQGRLAFAGAVSVVLHAGVLLSGIAQPPGFAHKRSVGGFQPLILRLVPENVQPPAAAPSSQPSDPRPASIAAPRAPREAAAEEQQATRTPPAAGPSASRGPLAPSGYYSARDVDVRATPIGEIEPSSPDLTGTVTGYVVLRLQINAQGTVDRIIVDKAVPDYAFGPGTFASFERARFEPARKNGQAVPSEMKVELHYQATRLPVPPQSR